MDRPKSELDAERNAARKVIKALLNAGYTVGINDGEETTIKRSTDKTALYAALWTTDEDYIYAYNAEDDFPFKGFPKGKRIGWVYLVYGNSPEELVSDYTTNLETILYPAGQEAA